MADLTQGRSTPRRGPSLHSVSAYLEDGYQVAVGTIVALAADGYALSAGHAGAVTVAGVYDPQSGATLGQDLSVVGDGSTTQANRIDITCGIFDFDNYATHPVLMSSVGALGYAKDNHTISVNSGDGPVVGRITFLNGDGSVSIQVGLPGGNVD
jgi:hypothetical protein